MSKRKETWWCIKFVEPETGKEQIASSMERYKSCANQTAIRYRGYGARNVRVVPCDPPKLRHPINPG